MILGVPKGPPCIADAAKDDDVKLNLRTTVSNHVLFRDGEVTVIKPLNELHAICFEFKYVPACMVEPVFALFLYFFWLVNLQYKWSFVWKLQRAVIIKNSLRRPCGETTLKG